MESVQWGPTPPGEVVRGTLYDTFGVTGIVGGLGNTDAATGRPLDWSPGEMGFGLTTGLASSAELFPPRTTDCQKGSFPICCKMKPEQSNYVWAPRTNHRGRMATFQTTRRLTRDAPFSHSRG